MKQSSTVPKKPTYGIIGQGRVATHLCHYFELKAIPFTQWHKQSKETVEQHLANVDIILLAISDTAIDSFLKEHPQLQEKICLHFSGAHTSKLAWGFHPLMTFSTELYSLETYESILFVQEQHAPNFNSLFPILTNAFIKISEKDKAYYHAMCVMANNFTTLLWQKFFQEMKEKFDAPEASMVLFLQQTMKNITSNPDKALTGPLARNDKETLQKNMDALTNDPYLAVYQSFVQSYNYSLKQV